MPSNNNNKSSSSNSSLSFGKGKHSMAALALVVIIIAICVAYYYIYKKNREGFAAGGSDGQVPNLTAASGECVVALFYADWCPHCVAFKPDFMSAKSDMDGKKTKSGKSLRFVLVDCVEYKDLSKKYDVSGYPTVKILNDDGSSSEYSGQRNYDDLSKYLTSNN